MILTVDQIRKNITWLLSNGSPPVRFLTLKNLVKSAPDSGEVKAEWRQVEAYEATREIFGKQESDGSWCTGGSWAMQPSYSLKAGRDPFTPKYVTTVWVLPLLAEMGFTVRDARIRKACDYVLSSGYFLNPLFQSTPPLAFDKADISPCRFAQYLIALSMAGLADDRRVRSGYEFLLHQQRPDGGWILEQHRIERGWTRSCPFSTYNATMALDQAGETAYREALIEALGFIAWHLSTKSRDELCRFFYHGHSTVRELLMFAEYRVGLNESAVQTILGWLMSMYQADEGHFKYRGKPLSRYSYRMDAMDARVAKYRLYHLIEDDWFTYYMTRIGSALLEA